MNKLGLLALTSVMSFGAMAEKKLVSCEVKLEGNKAKRTWFYSQVEDLKTSSQVFEVEIDSGETKEITANLKQVFPYLDDTDKNYKYGFGIVAFSGDEKLLEIESDLREESLEEMEKENKKRTKRDEELLTKPVKKIASLDLDQKVKIKISMNNNNVSLGFDFPGSMNIKDAQKINKARKNANDTCIGFTNQAIANGSSLKYAYENNTVMNNGYIELGNGNWMQWNGATVRDAISKRCSEMSAKAEENFVKVKTSKKDDVQIVEGEFQFSPNFTLVQQEVKRVKAKNEKRNGRVNRAKTRTVKTYEKVNKNLAREVSFNCEISSTESVANNNSVETNSFDDIEARLQADDSGSEAIAY